MSGSTKKVDMRKKIIWNRVEKGKISNTNERTEKRI
jgi:hypothetical protein